MLEERGRLAHTLLVARWVVPIFILAFVAIYQIVQLTVVDRLGVTGQFAANFLVYGGSGALVGWLALTLIARDMVEHERSDAKTRERDQYLANITTESADAILSLNADGVIQSWSRGAEQIFGYTSDEVVGKHFGLLVPDDLKAQGEVEHLTQMVAEKGYIRSYETERQTKDGRRVFVDITRTLITDKAGKVIGYSAIIRDITARKQAETEIRQLNRELEARVAQRTQELQRASEELRQRNAELERANRELKELDRLKSDFISMVSHELRAPLTNINGALELLAAETAGDEETPGRAMLNIVTDQAARLTRFVQGVLNVSRIEAGALSFQFSAVDVWPLISKVVGDFAAHSQLHRFVLAGESPQSPAWADRDRLEEVLTNLVDNAVKYSPNGGDILIEARQVANLGLVKPGQAAAGGPVIVISVTDQGVGISEAEQERIFERFYRVDRKDSREVYGHGLVLYIARKLIEAHGGLLWVESTAGMGSRFSFAIPVADEQQVNNPRH